ncbi:hypothetical protein HanHA300_Chr17g0647491 [Helianthus annuus]|nr:hypothetical protein HanHA300_Chr17g0647491 [Helianthus annuus]KAJ0446899.1 hypothetical protein HanHA89_Chr17g0699381 [Helianthus annuus]KAJ0631793.1 hypothetical protein HanLR1_Chr17g0657931 [Helianthus annuus]KAJ0635701.1 hypothetical protein HanOQP8_Chr17g0653781 [Helianthus annuus]
MTPSPSPISHYKTPLSAQSDGVFLLQEKVWWRGQKHISGRYTNGSKSHRTVTAILYDSEAGHRYYLSARGNRIELYHAWYVIEDYLFFHVYVMCVYAMILFPHALY